MPSRMARPGVIAGVSPILVTHLHPLILLGSYILQFDNLVTSPASTLLSGLLPLAVIQTTYAVLCLDAGSYGDGTGQKVKTGRRPVYGAKKTDSHSTQGAIGEKILPASLSLLLSATLGTAIMYLTIPPLVYVHKLDGQKWREIFAFMIPIDEVFGAAVGAMIGAWCGAVPIPLDWGRPWQEWPITIITGAYLGYAVGKFAGMYALTGKKLVF
ncbi:GPI biosynthesis protein Pig-F [Kalaharituber pfeilii]|nr:GPI biosynthesis protein Pig-F [Kalaharituber pfeilii]